MNISLDKSILNIYQSGSQRARVLTETWVEENIYCLSCGNEQLNKFRNNEPVADFYCSSCNSEYELKSKHLSFPKKIVDGAYTTMIERITSKDNPSFFFLGYSLKSLEVINFIVIPKHFFTAEIIEKRKPLSETARRAGWTGCNILIDKIPNFGKLFLIRDGKIEDKQHVLEVWQKTSFLENQEVKRRGWTIEVMRIVDRMEGKFSLNEIYAYENVLSLKFPNNRFIKDKLRQQLQILRDKNLIEFISRGIYRKVITQ